MVGKCCCVVQCLAVNSNPAAQEECSIISTYKSIEMTNYCPVEEELNAYTLDLSRLFRDFDSANSLRFEEFCQKWRDLNFSFVHCGKKSLGDRNQGTERLLRCISGFFNPETKYIYRIAAIYSAYAVYYTQICKPKVKIRMTTTMWNDLKQLQSLVRQSQHNDVDYVITKLENDKAFVFTAMPKQLEYGNKELMTNMESSGSEVVTLRKYYIPDQYIQDTIKHRDFFESTTTLESEYLAVKSDIFKDFSGKLDKKTISCLNTKQRYCSGILNEVFRFQKWLEGSTRTQAGFDNSQRPVPKKLIEKEDKDVEILQKVSPGEENYRQARAGRIQALKLQSFRQPIPGIVQVEGRSNVESEGSSNIVKKRANVRRSALVEKREMRPWVKRWTERVADSSRTWNY